MDWHRILFNLAEMSLYSLGGFALLGVAILLVKLIVPFSIRHEIEDEQNVALAVLIGAVIVAFAIIIAAVMMPPAVSAIK